MNITIESYNNNFERYIERTPKQVGGEHLPRMEDFCSSVKGDKKVFELGSAFLRDAKFMREWGLNVFCTDVIAQSLQMAKDEVFECGYYDFQEPIKQEWEGQFDAVIANAVLLHATLPEFVFALQNILKLLKVGGVFELTLKKGFGEEIENQKLGADRYFKYWQRGEVEAILKETGFKLSGFQELENGKWLCFKVFK